MMVYISRNDRRRGNHPRLLLSACSARPLLLSLAASLLTIPNATRRSFAVAVHASEMGIFADIAQTGADHASSVEGDTRFYHAQHAQSLAGICPDSFADI